MRGQRMTLNKILSRRKRKNLRLNGVFILSHLGPEINVVILLLLRI
jgi:hypothetical protein